MLHLLSVLRKQTNGVVSDSMRDKGIVWPLNYGVSIPSIRASIQEYCPDHSFGKFLYEQQIRELRLSGLMICSPEAVTAEELPFWARGVINTEVAEHISYMLSRSSVLGFVLEQWLVSGNVLLSYAAMLSATRKLIMDRSAVCVDVDRTLESIRHLIPYTASYLWRSVASFLNALYRFSPVCRIDIERFAWNLVKDLPSSVSEYFKEELYLSSDC